MNYQNPQLLYALFALAIPVLIHLFNLRRHKTILFSSVRFLKDIKQDNTRKRNIKNILVLITRLFATAFLILAFCKPFTKDEKNLINSDKVFVYLDNSFSMDAIDEDGRLIDIAKNYALSIAKSHVNEKVYLLTNNIDNQNTISLSSKEFINKINEVETDGNSKNINQILQIKESISTSKDKIYILSDFQKEFILDDYINDNKNIIKLIPINNPNTNNISLDSLWINQPIITSKNEIEIFLKVSNYGNETNNTSVSLEINNKLQTKRIISIEEDRSKVYSFKIIVDQVDNINGKFIIEDYPISFDNTLYFSLNKSQKVNILNIYENQELNNFNYLFKDTSMFNYSTTNISNIQYSNISYQDFVLLNEIQSVSEALEKYLIQILQKGSSICLIPSKDFQLENFNDFLKKLDVNTFKTTDTNTYIIENINYLHPLYSNVFDGDFKEIKYPKVSFSYSINNNNISNKILSQFNNQEFLSQYNCFNSNFYVFNSPLSHNKNNFRYHALFVPTFLNMALESKKINRLYSVINKDKYFVSNKKLTNDTYHVINDKSDIIPTFKSLNGKSLFFTNNQITKAGFYKLFYKNKILENISFNYNMREGSTQFYSKKMINSIISNNNKNISILDLNIKKINNIISNESEGKQYWKLCLLLCLFFFALEMLIIKIIK